LTGKKKKFRKASEACGEDEETEKNIREAEHANLIRALRFFRDPSVQAKTSKKEANKEQTIFFLLEQVLLFLLFEHLQPPFLLHRSLTSWLRFLL
jgi:hypothetical protein